MTHGDAIHAATVVFVSLSEIRDNAVGGALSSDVKPYEVVHYKGTRTVAVRYHWSVQRKGELEADAYVN